MEQNQKINLQALQEYAIAQKTIWKTLSNENRINILYKLYEGTASWSDLMFSLKINPKSLNSHLNFLMEHLMVEKTNGHYGITNFGKEVCEMRIFNEIRFSVSSK